MLIVVGTATARDSPDVSTALRAAAVYLANAHDMTSDGLVWIVDDADVIHGRVATRGHNLLLLGGPVGESIPPRTAASFTGLCLCDLQKHDARLPALHAVITRLHCLDHNASDNAVTARLYGNGRVDVPTQLTNWTPDDRHDTFPVRFLGSANGFRVGPAVFAAADHGVVFTCGLLDDDGDTARIAGVIAGNSATAIHAVMKLVGSPSTACAPRRGRAVDVSTVIRALVVGASHWYLPVVDCERIGVCVGVVVVTIASHGALWCLFACLRAGGAYHSSHDPCTAVQPRSGLHGRRCIHRSSRLRRRAGSGVLG